MNRSKSAREFTAYIVALALIAIFALSSPVIGAELKLSWQDNSDDELGFSIERATGPAGPYNEIATVETNITTYRDLGLPSATTLCYRVRAFDPFEYSDYGTAPDGVTKYACAMTPQMYNLAVIKKGAGTGSVTSAPPGINCGPACSAEYESGTSVTLTASPASGSIFTGWSGGGCSGKKLCIILTTGSTIVTARFAQATTLTVLITGGTGRNKVTSKPAGISCIAPGCSADFPIGTVVTLTANASRKSIFIDWSGGGCAGTGTCIVTLTSATTVTATFGDQ